MKIIFKRNTNDREMWDMITHNKMTSKPIVWATIHDDFLPGLYSDRENTNEVVLIAEVSDDA